MTITATRWLPQLDAIALRTHHPTEPAVFAFVDTKVHHEGLVARRKILCVLRKWRPQCVARPRGVFSEHRATKLFDLQPQCCVSDAQ
jgi:hypothetical protein